MLATIKDAVRTFGGLNGSLFLAGQALSRATAGHCALKKYYIVAQPVPHQRLCPEGKGRAVEVKLLTVEEIRALPWPRPMEVIERRMRDGALCFGAFIKGQFVGFQWVCLGAYEEDDVRTLFVPEPAGHAAWDFDIYVHPDHRLGRAFVRLWDEMNMMLIARGVNWSVSRISAFAPDSMRSHARMSAQRIGTCFYVQLGPMQIALLSRAPFIHVGFNSRQRPVFRAEAPA